MIGTVPHVIIGSWTFVVGLGFRGLGLLTHHGFETSSDCGLSVRVDMEISQDQQPRVSFRKALSGGLLYVQQYMGEALSLADYYSETKKQPSTNHTLE